MRCLFVGDVALGDHPKSVGFGFHSKYRGGIPLQRARELLPEDSPDVFFGNLEFSLAHSELTSPRYDERHCRGVSGYLKFLEEAGFTHLNVANNHMYQYGADDFDDTVSALEERGILPVGLGAQEVRVPDAGAEGWSVAFLGWSTRPRQGFSETPGYAEFDREKALVLIEQAAREHRHVIVSMHWGDEFVEVPGPREQSLGRAMIDSGATLVIGHHPHVVREVEEYAGGLIAYSLGNFICDMIWNEVTRRTCYLDVKLSAHGIKRWALREGRIGDDFFPKFFDESSSPGAGQTWPEPADHEPTYRRLLEKAHRRHRRLTVFHMVRNAFRYEPRVWLTMAKNATLGRMG